jgi:3-oxoacyl-[acyl-carrier protein] reductase
MDRIISQSAGSISPANASSTALVTGASGGIGRAIALRLGRDGYRVLVHYNRGREAAESTLNSLKNQGSQAHLIQFDVKDSGSVDQALENHLKDYPDHEIDVLVNNAGINADNLAGLMSDEAFTSVMRTNVDGSFFLMRACVRKMMRRRRGSIVNIASLSGQIGNPGQINYAASKAAMIAMTKTLSFEVGSRGIRVNCVSPGLIETEMIHEIPNLDEYKKRIPLARLGSPDDVAGAVSFLCSKDAAYITGATISVNGGLFPG